MTLHPFNFLARLKGFEPLTYGLEVRCSIQLSYRRSANTDGLLAYNPEDVHKEAYACQLTIIKLYF